MHILILPSWYPTHSKDLSGSFFREQALALKSHGCKVGILAIENSSIANLKNFKASCYGVREDIDEGMYTLRYFGINFFPRLYYFQKKNIEKLGMNLFDTYVKNNGLPDVIHVQSIFNSGYLANKIKKKYNVPYVITEHSSSFVRGVVTESQLKLSKECVSFASKLFAVSRSTCNLLESKYLGSQWSIMPNTVNHLFFEHDGIKKNGKFTFFTACVLNDNKNVNVIIESFYKSFGSSCDTELWIAGEGENKKKLENQVELLKLNNKVKFLGELTREEVAKVMAQSHVFVLASKHETFGLVVAESHAVGTPVIATRSGGPDDIITEKNGILVSPNSVPELSEALCSLRNSYNDYNPNKIRESCYHKYSEVHLAKKLCNAFKVIIENDQYGN